MRTWKLLVEGMGVLAPLAATAACSSSSKNAATDSRATTAASGPASAAASPKGAPVKVGVICSCSGAFGASHTATGDVAQACAKSVNAAAGIEGHLIDVTFLDDASNPGTSATDAQSLISDHVAVIVDLSNFAATWESAATAAKIPVVGGDFENPLYNTNLDFYPSATTNDASYYSVANTTERAGGTNFGFRYSAEAAICAEQVSSQKAAGERVGVPLICKASIWGPLSTIGTRCELRGSGDTGEERRRRERQKPVAPTGAVFRKAGTGF